MERLSEERSQRAEVNNLLFSPTGCNDRKGEKEDMEVTRRDGNDPI